MVFVSLTVTSPELAIFCKTITLPWKKNCLLTFTFFEIVKTNMDRVPSAFTPIPFLPSKQNLFAELLLDQHLNLLVDSDQLLLVYNDFRCNHNPTNILWYNLHLELQFTFYFFISLYIRIKRFVIEAFSINDDFIILDDTVW